MDAVEVSVITVSNEIAAGSDQNRAGPVALELLAGFGARADLVVGPDDVDAVAAAVRAARGRGSRVIVTSGGTGVGPDDVTVDAVAGLLDFQVPGVCEEIRRRGAEHGPSALISREVAGVIRGQPSVFVLTAPGSRGGVRDALAVLGPLLVHIVAQLDGAGHL